MIRKGQVTSTTTSGFRLFADLAGSVYPNTGFSWLTENFATHPQTDQSLSDTTLLGIKDMIFTVFRVLNEQWLLDAMFF